MSAASAEVRWMRCVSLRVPRTPQGVCALLAPLVVWLRLPSCRKAILASGKRRAARCVCTRPSVHAVMVSWIVTIACSAWLASAAFQSIGIRMESSCSVVGCFRLAVVLSLAPGRATRHRASHVAPWTNAEWLSPHVGKEFFVSENLTVATERARTTAVPSGAVAFTLAGVGTEFDWFENKTDRVSVPLASLRVALRR